MSFGIEGEGTAPASLPGLSGTTYWYDYRSAHGKLFRVQGGSSSFNAVLADLIEINNGGFRDELAGSVFLFQNDKSGGSINFTGGGIADIRPTTAQGGATVTPGFAAICTLNPHATTRFALLVAAWNRAADTGATAAQIARLLPTLPASGSRDNKIPKFDGDVLGWEDEASSRSVATPRQVATLPASPYIIGDLVYLTRTVGSNTPGLYQVFDARTGYEKVEIRRPGYMAEPDVLFNNTTQITSGGSTISVPNWTTYDLIQLVFGKRSAAPFDPVKSIWLTPKDLTIPLATTFDLLSDARQDNTPALFLKLVGNSAGDESVRTTLTHIRLSSTAGGYSALHKIYGWKY